MTPIPTEVEGALGVDSVVEVGRGSVRVTGGGLRPPAPRPVAPNGIPTRPTGARNEFDPVGCAKAVVPPPAQVPDAFPVVPPPSNTVANPAVELPMLEDAPVVELPMLEGAPAIELPTLEDVPVVEIGEPKDASGIEPPKPEQSGMLLDEEPNGDEMPGVAISVAPSGIPAGPTGEVIPSGEVGPMPTGEPAVVSMPETCATAGPQPKTVARIAVVNKRAILGFSCALMCPHSL